ncbi:hypothetical protein LAZ67_16002713 [Cordylochernes scorpioides]|uniref:Tc1-like transposase DDE domain-containing protein n=1 Tax=Cordylochernes scorpioides TaxID=51811 RepID=A0ABY6LC89_9ARAC|nr:hypothetical protein LAZ67_16002713 [Cordylochernes scorpioides]
MFSEGREDVNDKERAERPSISTTDEKINEVEKMILANRRITVREVAEDLNISIGSCHSILINDLGMRRVAAKFVPKLLNCDQKQHRMNIANEMLDSVRADPNLFQRVITGDETWVYGYDVETKAQSSQWKLPHEPRPKKARQVRSNVKVLLTVFFDCRGVVHHEFLPQGRTVNKEYYLQVMRNLREAIRQKRPDLWKNKNWLLHHDNAPAHTSLLVHDFLAKNNTLMMPQPPYSQICPPRMPGHRKRRQFKQTDAFTRGMVIGLKRAVKVAVYACGVDVEKGPIRQQLWNVPPCDNVESWFGAQSRMIPPLLRIQGTMTAQRYVDDVLRPVTLPYLQGVPNALYQQDNARPHTARISQQALQDVQMLPWPPYCPDLSPIEHVWDIIGRRLHALPQPRSEDELWQMVEREWKAIPQDAIRTLIDPLPRRVAACIAVRGGPTCY